MPPDLHSATVRELRADIPRLVNGILLLSIGVSASLLFRLRTRSKDPALFWFGVFAGLYGVRLAAITNFLRFTTAPLPYAVWAYLVSAITYVILLPAALFLAEIFPAWRAAIRWLVWFQAAFAAAGVISDQFRHHPESLTAFRRR